MCFLKTGDKEKNFGAKKHTQDQVQWMKKRTYKSKQILMAFHDF